MNGNKTGIGRALWLHMAKEGGRWNGVELAGACERRNNDIHGALRALTTGGFVVRYDLGKRPQFGVTRSCKVPSGVTLNDLRQVGAI